MNIEINEPYTTQSLREALAQKYEGLKAMVMDTETITLAVNQEYVTGIQDLREGDEVALIPPISGG